MPNKFRTLGEVFGAPCVEDKRPADMQKLEWRRSFDGVSSALESIGLKMEMTREEFDAVPVPENRAESLCYERRKIIVSRNGINSKPTRIDALLSGASSLRTKEELQESYNKVSNSYAVNQPQGVSCNTAKETSAIDRLDALLEMEKYVQRQHLVEFRLADIAYALLDANFSDDVFAADQVKSAHVENNGRVDFHINVAIMLELLTKGLSLTCIALTKTDTIDVVYFFHGQAAIEMLEDQKSDQIFKPTLHLQARSNHPFTIAYNQSQFRFDINDSEAEKNRLRDTRLQAVGTSDKHSLLFLNEDDTQIPCLNHRVEQQSFSVIRAATLKIGAQIARFQKDAYGSIDFRLNGKARIQNKSGKKMFNMRGYQRHPYDPDSIDIFQVHVMESNMLYAVPMRKLKEKEVVSFFTEKELMACTVALSKDWVYKHSRYLYDLNTVEGIKSYTVACEAASQLPQITDRTFYHTILGRNQIKFGTPRQKQIKTNKMAN